MGAVCSECMVCPYENVFLTLGTRNNEHVPVFSSFFCCSQEYYCLIRKLVVSISFTPWGPFSCGKHSQNIFVHLECEWLMSHKPDSIPFTCLEPEGKVEEPRLSPCPYNWLPPSSRAMGRILHAYMVPMSATLKAFFFSEIKSGLSYDPG